MSGMIRATPRPQFRKGQAWVIFDNADAAKKALTQMQGFPFHDKPMVRSHLFLAFLFVCVDTLLLLQKIAYSKNKSDIVAKEDGTYVKREKRQIKPEPKTEPKAEKKEEAGAGFAQPPPPKRPAVQQQNNAPHNILFAEGLPDDCTDKMLIMLFQQYGGYKEVRLIQHKKVAFIDYADALQAGVALQNLNGFKLTPEHPMSVSYAKK
jgi:RNA recognition motif-containing protein